VNLLRLGKQRSNLNKYSYKFDNPLRYIDPKHSIKNEEKRRIQEKMREDKINALDKKENQEQKKARNEELMKTRNEWAEKINKIAKKIEA
jgi:hypothetical protein